jgi:response regulator RpfG family c-di-GMP phosphodiesterase
MNDEFINIEISNPDHYIPRPALDMLLLGQTEGAPRHAPGSELYPASLLLQEMDGRLKIVSERGKGITYTAIIPKKWPNWIQEVSALQLATEISRKEARAELKNIHNMLLSLAEQAPSEMKDSLEKISSKVQELGVLCNRSLFLADDLNRRLETQQDRLLQQEMEQLATTEAVVAISREIARSMQLPPIFDIDSAKKVAKYALAMAQEFELSESECRTLHHAALLKDLGLILSVHDMVEQKFVPTLESAMAVRASFNLVWKALSSVPFLSSALVSIQYQHERYDGTGSYFGAKGASIPLGARILAVADTFEAMTSSLSPQGKSAPKQAVEKIMEDSGRRFDPDVVNAFLSVWKRKELHPALSEP